MARIISSELTDKNDRAGTITHTATRDGREQIRFNADAIAYILGRYACEKFPEIMRVGFVDIKLGNDENGDEEVTVTESTISKAEQDRTFQRGMDHAEAGRDAEPPADNDMNAIYMTGYSVGEMNRDSKEAGK